MGSSVKQDKRRDVPTHLGDLGVHKWLSQNPFERLEIFTIKSPLPNRAVASTRAVTRCVLAVANQRLGDNFPRCQMCKRPVFGHSPRVLWRSLFSGWGTPGWGASWHSDRYTPGAEYSFLGYRFSATKSVQHFIHACKKSVLRLLSLNLIDVRLVAHASFQLKRAILCGTARSIACRQSMIYRFSASHVCHRATFIIGIFTTGACCVTFGRTNHLSASYMCHCD